MKPIGQWSLSAQLTSGAALLAAFVGIIASSQTLADKFPFPTKGQVQELILAENTKSFDALSGQLTQALAAINQLSWNEVIYRSKDLEEKLPGLVANQVVLQDYIDRNPGANDIIDKKTQLKNLGKRIDDGEQELARLQCQIEHRESAAAC